MSTITSHGRYSQSMGAKDICILLVNSDHICHDVVVDMLQHCCYEVFSYEREMDTLNIIWERKDKLELILTNVHRTDANKFGIIEHIEKELKLQIILMSPEVDNINNLSSGDGIGATVYIVKSLSMKEINNLWAKALAREKGKRELSRENSEQQGKENTSSSDFSEAIEDCQKRKRDMSEQDGGSKDESHVEKKPRVVWTKEMHQKFLEAIAQLGHDKAFPKKIVEIMNVPGLTRENVASHLQKYRLCMKRAQEGVTGSFYGLNFNYNVAHPLGFNVSQGNSQQSHWNPRMGSGGFNISIPNSSCYGFDWEGSRLKAPHSTLANYHRNVQCSYPSRNVLSSNGSQIRNSNLRIYGDNKKNVLLSIDSNYNREPLNNTSFIGFRLAGDGKSVEFGQDGHLGHVGIRSNIQRAAVSSTIFNPQQQCSLPQPENDNSSYYSLFPVSSTPQQQSSAALLGTEQDTSVNITSHQQCSIALSGTDCRELANFAQQQYLVSPLENNVHDDSVIFGDSMSLDQPSLLPPQGFCELESFGMGGDGDGLDVIEKTARSLVDEDFDDIFVHHQDMTS